VLFESLIALALLLAAIIGTPGPNNLLLFNTALNAGRGPALALLLAINAGVGCVVVSSLLIASGLQAWLLEYRAWMLGASSLLLLYFAYGSWPSRSASNSDSNSASLLAAFVLQWLNPKIWLLASGLVASFYPQLSAQILVLATLLAGLICNSAWLLLGLFSSRLSTHLQHRLGQLGALLLLAVAVYLMWLGWR